MKIVRFRYNHGKGFAHSYAYLICNWWEVILMKQRAKGNKRIAHYPNAPGPRNWGAQFIVSARKQSKC